MVTTTIYIVSILVVLVLGAIVAWLMRKNAITLNKQLHQGNQDLKKQLQEAGGKVEKLSSENVNLKNKDFSKNRNKSKRNCKNLKLQELVVAMI